MISRWQLNSQRTYDSVIDVVSVPEILCEVPKVESNEIHDQGLSS